MFKNTTKRICVLFFVLFLLCLTKAMDESYAAGTTFAVQYKSESKNVVYVNNSNKEIEGTTSSHTATGDYYTPGEDYTVHIRIKDGYTLATNMIGLSCRAGTDSIAASSGGCVIESDNGLYNLTGDVYITIPGSQTSKWRGYDMTIYIDKPYETKTITIVSDMDYECPGGNVIRLTNEYSRVIFSPKATKTGMHLCYKDIEVRCGGKKVDSSKWGFYEEDQRVFFKGSDFSSLIGNIVVYANGSFPVTFDANGGSGSMETLYVLDGESFVVPKNTFTPPVGKMKGLDGYQWSYYKPRYGDVEVQVGGTLEVVQPRTLKAVWVDEIKYNVDLLGITDNNEQFTFSSQSIIAEEKVTKPQKPGLHNGYCMISLDDWYTDKSFKNKYYFSTSVTKDLVIYGKWTVPQIKNLTTEYNKGVTLTWDTVPGATYYQIYRKTSGGSWQLVDTISGTTWIDTNGKPGTKYFYSLSALINGIYSNKNENGWSIVYEKLDAPVLKSVINDGPTKNHINWTSPKGADYIQVWRTTKADAEQKDYVCIGIYNASDNTSTSKLLKPDTKYYYKVRAYRKIGNTNYYSGYSEVKSATTLPLNAPCIKTITSLSTTTARVEWQAQEGTEFIQVWRTHKKNAEQKDYVCIGVYNATDLSCISKMLTPGKTYYYKIRGYVKCGENRYYSGYSDVKGVTLPPEKVSGVTVTKKSETSSIVKWKTVYNAQYYVVEKSTSKDGIYTTVGIYGSSTQQATANNLQQGKVYYYRVRAYVKDDLNVKIYGEYSNTVECKQ